MKLSRHLSLPTRLQRTHSAGLGLKSGEPEYFAVSMCWPTAKEVVTNVAVPALGPAPPTCAMPRTLLPSRNVTWPVVTSSKPTDTVAVRVTGDPEAIVWLLSLRRVVEGAGTTACALTMEALPLMSAFPVKAADSECVPGVDNVRGPSVAVETWAPSDTSISPWGGLVARLVPTRSSTPSPLKSPTAAAEMPGTENEGWGSAVNKPACVDPSRTAPDPADNRSRSGRPSLFKSLTTMRFGSTGTG